MSPKSPPARSSVRRQMNLLEWGLLVLLSAIWGGSFFFAAVALAELPPFAVLAGRVGIAALALHLLLRLLGIGFPADLKLWRDFLGMGFLNNLVPFSLILWGQTQIASGLASILNATTPLFGVIVAHLLTRDEKLSRGKFAGASVGFLGVAAMIGPDALAGIGAAVWPQLAVLAAALSYAIAGVFGRRFKAHPPLLVATGQVSASSLMVIPLALIVDRPWALDLPSPAAWGAVIGIALLCTALAYVIFFRILATAGATNLLLVTFLIPVSALILGIAFLSEVILPRHFLGMAAIGLGLAAIDGRPWNWLKRRLMGKGGMG